LREQRELRVGWGDADKKAARRPRWRKPFLRKQLVKTCTMRFRGNVGRDLSHTLRAYVRSGRVCEVGTMLCHLGLGCERRSGGFKGPWASGSLCTSQGRVSNLMTEESARTTNPPRSGSRRPTARWSIRSPVTACPTQAHRGVPALSWISKAVPAALTSPGRCLDLSLTSLHSAGKIARWPLGLAGPRHAALRPFPWESDWSLPARLSIHSPT
jgi:hypothetical protein